MKLAEAKQRLTIDILWGHFGFAGKPSKSCPCPFHEDKSNSFSVDADGTLFNCFSGCGGGDSVDFFALASGLPDKEACKAFISMAGGSLPPLTPHPPRPTQDVVDRDKSTQREQWPLFDVLTDEATSTLAKLRHVSLEGVRLAAERGLLWLTAWKGLPAWVVTDDARKNAQVRRMDGGRWASSDGPKALTLPGSEATRPIGARESQQFPTVLFCEGGPDLLAAHHFIHAHGRQQDVAAVCALGAGLNIHPASLPIFAGKRIRLFPHTDAPGRAAAARWTEQLAAVRATVDAFNFDGLLTEDGSQAKDLNDCNRITPNQIDELSNLIP